MVRKYLLSLSKRCWVVNTTVATATAKALVSKYPQVVGQVEVDSSRWAKRERSSKVDNSDEVRKEIEFVYLHDIVSKVEKYDISSTLVVNIDQTLLKYVPVGNETITAKGGHCVTNEGSADKRSITGTFAISFDGNFLPVQLIYGGKVTQNLPRFEFPKGLSLSTNSKIFQTRMNRLSS